MRSIITRTIILSLIIFIVAGCSSTGTVNVPKPTPEQVWAGAKIAARIGGAAYVRSQCKDGKFAGVECQVAVDHVGSIVDTLADDFKPGAVVDPAKRTATRDAAATELARALHGADFATADDEAKNRQAKDVAEARQIIDTIADALVAALGK